MGKSAPSIVFLCVETCISMGVEIMLHGDTGASRFVKQINWDVSTARKSTLIISIP